MTSKNKFASSILTLPINLFFGVLGYMNLFIYPKIPFKSASNQECTSIYDSGFVFPINIFAYPLCNIDKTTSRTAFKRYAKYIAIIIFSIPAAIVTGIVTFIDIINKFFSSFELLKYINPLTVAMHLKKKIGNSNYLFYLLVTSSALLAVAFFANKKLLNLKIDPSVIVTALISLVMLTFLYKFTKKNNHHYSLDDSQKIWFFTLSLLTGPFTYLCKFRAPNKLQIALIGSSPLILLILFKLSNYITFEPKISNPYICPNADKKTTNHTDNGNTKTTNHTNIANIATDLFSFELWGSDFKQEIKA